VIREMGKAYDLGSRCLLLVPEQYTLQAELELIRLLDLPGFFDLEVLSPSRLTYRVFERAGAPHRVRIDTRGKRMVMRCALEEMSGDLRFYKRAASYGGFADEMIELIGDLKRGAVLPEAVSALCAPLEENDPLRAKLEDVAAVYSAYERRMAGRFVDGEDVEIAMRERIEASGLFLDAEVWVSGFDVLTEAFAETLTTVARHAKALCVSLVMDSPPSGDAELYAPVAASVARWERMLTGAGLTWKRDREDARLPAAPALAHLERELYAYPAHAMHSGPVGNALVLRACSTPFAEVCRAAEQILAWVRGDGIAWHEIAVQYTDTEVYAGLIRQVFSRYNIPHYVDQKATAGRHPLIAGLLAALRCATQGYLHEDAMRYLKSGFCGLNDREGFLLEKYALEHGLRGAGWKRTLARGGDEAVKAEPLRERFAEPLVELQNSLRVARDADGTLRAVVTFLERIGAFDALEAYGAQLEGAGLSAEAAFSAQIWAHLMETLDQMHALLDGRRGTSDALVDMLSSGLADAELGALPPSPHVLLCGMLGHIRPGRVRALLVLGLNDGKLNGPRPGLLTDVERRRAAQLSPSPVYLGMDADARALLARLDVLQALTLPEERLWLGYSLADATGASQRPAMVCAQIKRIFPALDTIGDLEQDGGAFSASPRAALDALGPELRRAYDAAEMPAAHAREAYAWLRSQPEWRGEADDLTAGLCARVDTGAALISRAVPTSSISRLERYAECPYRYFVEYILRPSPIDDYGVRSSELGIWYHAAMEAYTRLAVRQPGWPQISREHSDALMDEAMGPLLEDWRLLPLMEDAQGRAMGRRVFATARRAAWTLTAQLQGGEFMPAAMELFFGHGEIPGLVLAMEGGEEVVLQGRIDRLDTWRADDAEYLRVVDYKSSAVEHKLDPTKLYWGLQQQLPLYLAAALRIMPGTEPAGMFYFRVHDPLIALRPVPDDGDAGAETGRYSRLRDTVETERNKKLRMTGMMLEDSLVAQALGGGEQITADGLFKKTAPVASPERFRRLLRHTQSRAAGFARRIQNGDIGVRPAQLDYWNACQSCGCASICGIDPLLEGGRAEALRKMNMNELHEALEREQG